MAKTAVHYSPGYKQGSRIILCDQKGQNLFATASIGSVTCVNCKRELEQC